MTNSPGGLPRSLGGYELVERVGGGGMGTVYRAIDRRSGTTVAVKIIHDHLQRDATFVERFRDEAHLASLMTSPYIVRVLEFGVDQQQYFLATEFVEGSRLSDLIAAKRLTTDESLAIASQVAMELQAAAAHRVVHRDVKPDNIIITPDKFVKLMDFGVARLSYVETRQLFLGTVAYAAPEQFRGQTTIRSDIYSLGIVLFQMLAGELPFKGDTLSSLIRMHDDTPPPMHKLTGVPPPLKDIVAKCLEKDPDKRYADPSELLEALRRVRTTLTSSDDATWMANTMVGLASSATVIQPGAERPSSQAPPELMPLRLASAQSIASRVSAPLSVSPASHRPEASKRKAVPPAVLVAAGAGLAGIVIALFLIFSESRDSSAESRRAAVLDHESKAAVAAATNSIAPTVAAPAAATPALSPTAVLPAPPTPQQVAPAPALVQPPSVTANPTAALIAGTWEGTVHQTGTDSYPVVMTVGATSGQIRYATLSCGGSISLLRVMGSTYVFVEKIEYGTGNCVDNGRIEASLSGGRLAWVWFQPDGTRDATATLSKR